MLHMWAPEYSRRSEASRWGIMPTDLHSNSQHLCRSYSVPSPVLSILCIYSFNHHDSPITVFLLKTSFYRWRSWCREILKLPQSHPAPQRQHQDLHTDMLAARSLLSVTMLSNSGWSLLQWLLHLNTEWSKHVLVTAATCHPPQVQLGPIHCIIMEYCLILHRVRPGRTSICLPSALYIYYVRSQRPWFTFALCIIYIKYTHSPNRVVEIAK